jgi:hypothetical protein
VGHLRALWDVRARTAQRRRRLGHQVSPRRKGLSGDSIPTGPGFSAIFQSSADPLRLAANTPSSSTEVGRISGAHHSDRHRPSNLPNPQVRPHREGRKALTTNLQPAVIIRKWVRRVNGLSIPLRWGRDSPPAASQWSSPANNPLIEASAGSFSAPPARFIIAPFGEIFRLVLGWVRRDLAVDLAPIERRVHNDPRLLGHRDMGETSYQTDGKLQVISFCAVPLFVPGGRSFVPACACRRAARKGPSRLAVALSLPLARLA